jgi:hypothetical protein
MALSLTACDKPGSSASGGGAPSTVSSVEAEPSARGFTTIDKFAEKLPNGFTTPGEPGESIGYNKDAVWIIVQNEYGIESQGIDYAQTTSVEIGMLYSGSHTMRIYFCDIADYALTTIDGELGYTSGLARFLRELMENSGDSMETMLGLSPELTAKLAQTVQGEVLHDYILTITDTELSISEVFFDAGDGGFGSAYLQNQDGQDYYQISYRPTDQSSSWTTGFYEGKIKLSREAAGEMADVIVKSAAEAIPDNAADTSALTSVEADTINFRDDSGMVLLNNSHITGVESVSLDADNYAILFTLTDDGEDIVSKITTQKLSLFLGENNAMTLQKVTIVNGQLQFESGMTSKDEAEFVLRDLMARLSQ